MLPTTSVTTGFSATHGLQAWRRRRELMHFRRGNRFHITMRKREIIEWARALCSHGRYEWIAPPEAVPTKTSGCTKQELTWSGGSPKLLARRVWCVRNHKHPPCHRYCR